jgi:phage tail protein X
MDGFTFGLLSRVNRESAQSERDSADFRGKMARAQAIINRQHAENGELEAENKKLRHALAVEQARSAGLLARLNSFTEALRQANPAHALLALTGRVFRSGLKETVARAVFDRAFDAMLTELGYRNPENFRDTAK